MSLGVQQFLHFVTLALVVGCIPPTPCVELTPPLIGDAVAPTPKHNASLAPLITPELTRLRPLYQHLTPTAPRRGWVAASVSVALEVLTDMGFLDNLSTQCGRSGGWCSPRQSRGGSGRLS